MISIFKLKQRKEKKINGYLGTKRKKEEFWKIKERKVINNKYNNTREKLEDKKININKGKRIRFSNYKINFMIFILINSFIHVLQNSKYFLLELNYSNITLKIKGKGDKKVFTDQKQWFKESFYPNEVHINGNKQNKVNHTYNLEEDDNTIKLVWYDKPKTM